MKSLEAFRKCKIIIQALLNMSYVLRDLICYNVVPLLDRMQLRKKGLESKRDGSCC